MPPLNAGVIFCHFDFDSIVIFSHLFFFLRRVARPGQICITVITVTRKQIVEGYKGSSDS
jgi:hypothetical protein